MDSNNQPLVYVVKRINFNGKKVAIALQNINGPCPLLAVANVLSLRGHFSVHDDKSVVTADELLAAVSDYLFDANSASNEEHQRNYERNINDVIQMLPNTLVGIDVNLKFDKITSFEFNSDIMLFDFCNVRLVHGWLVDPQDQAYSFIRNLSYNQLVEKELARLYASGSITRSPTRGKLFVGTPNMSRQASIISEPAVTSTASTTTTTTTSDSNPSEPIQELNNVTFESKPPSSEASSSSSNAADLTDDKQTQALLAEQFLNDTATQLTYHGLTELHSGLNDEELCVFFRNNHFNTLYKHNGELFVLVTDQGYAQEPLVWEKLCQIDGDSTFLRGDFTPYQATSAITGLDDGIPPSANEDSDLALALQLQDEENRRQPPPAQQQAQGQAQGQGQGQPQGQLSADGKHHKHKHRKDCVIQ